MAAQPVPLNHRPRPRGARSSPPLRPSRPRGRHGWGWRDELSSAELGEAIAAWLRPLTWPPQWAFVR